MSWDETWQEFKKGFSSDYGIGRDDQIGMYRDTRAAQGHSIEGERMTTMLNHNMLLNRIREAAPQSWGWMDNAQRDALHDNDMGLRGGVAHKTGQFTGSMAADLTQDTTRSIWWLLNAPQATADVINDKVLHSVVPDLYGSQQVVHPTVKAIENNKKVPKALYINNKADQEQLLAMGAIKEDPQISGSYRPARGYSAHRTEAGTEIRRQNHAKGHIHALSIPAGIAINSGVGLMTPFGGYEGYKAVYADPNDPSKSTNFIGEIAAKYILGRTGQLLPYNEFKKVRPDVSREEYNRYQAFKYDKSEDLNPLDGNVSIGAGALRATTEGIHGPEVQFLGRSIPATTGILPLAAAIAGTAAGARWGNKRKRIRDDGSETTEAIRGGLGGGMAALAVGGVAGNLIEDERRRRNGIANGELPM